MAIKEATHVYRLDKPIGIKKKEIPITQIDPSLLVSLAREKTDRPVDSNAAKIQVGNLPKLLNATRKITMLDAARTQRCQVTRSSRTGRQASQSLLPGGWTYTTS